MFSHIKNGFTCYLYFFYQYFHPLVERLHRAQKVKRKTLWLLYTYNDVEKVHQSFAKESGMSCCLSLSLLLLLFFCSYFFLSSFEPHFLSFIFSMSLSSTVLFYARQSPKTHHPSLLPLSLYHWRFITFLRICKRKPGDMARDYNSRAKSKGARDVKKKLSTRMVKGWSKVSESRQDRRGQREMENERAR